MTFSYYPVLSHFPRSFVNHPLYCSFTQYCCQVIKCSWLMFEAEVLTEFLQQKNQTHLLFFAILRDLTDSWAAVMGNTSQLHFSFCCCFTHFISILGGRIKQDTHSISCFSLHRLTSHGFYKKNFQKKILEATRQFSILQYFPVIKTTP